MKQVYLAHQLSAPTQVGIQANIDNAKLWYRWACDHYWPDHCFNAMWILNCEVYDDANEHERAMGMKRNLVHIKTCDELWLLGPSISRGMLEEAEYAQRCGFPVRNLTGVEKPPKVRVWPADMPTWQPGSVSQQQVLF
jgi:hypothetical protein